MLLSSRKLTEQSICLKRVQVLLDELVDDFVLDFRLGQLLFLLAFAGYLGGLLRRCVILMLERLLKVVLDGQNGLELLSVEGHVPMDNLIDYIGDLKLVAVHLFLAVLKHVHIQMDGGL